MLFPILFEALNAHLPETTRIPEAQLPTTEVNDLITIANQRLAVLGQGGWNQECQLERVKLQVLMESVFRMIDEAMGSLLF